MLRCKWMGISRAALVLPLISCGLPSMALADTAAPQELEVIGHYDPDGLLPDQTVAKTVSALSADFITKQAPTYNAYQLVKMLPGANVSTTDPYGLSASSSLTLRGLSQDSIGVLMEGAPQNDIGYYVAYPSQFADAENIKQVSLAQGTVDIDSPVVSAVGGLLSLTLDDPKADMGALVNVSIGSYDQRRAFVRFDTGEIGSTGLKAFVSYSNTRADNWRGAGFDTRQHVDAKVLKEWGAGNRASLAASFNVANTSAYPSPTLEEWGEYGRGYNHDEQYNADSYNYWRLYRAPFRSLYFSAPVHLTLSDALDFDTTSYLQFGYGNAPYATGLSETGNYLGTEELTQPINLPGAVDGYAPVLGNWTGKQLRAGNVSKLTYKTGIHTLTAGIWFDYGRDRVMQTYTSLDANGRPESGWGRPRHAIETADGRILAYENQRTTITAKGFFLADSLALSSKWQLDIGFKGVEVERKGRNYLPGPQSHVHFKSFVPLPRASLRYQLDDQQQLYANISTSFRTPNEFALYNYYYGGEIVAKGADNLKNEYSVSQEIGYRYIGTNLSLSLSAFHYQFRNRQVATVINNGGALVNATVNAGRQRSYGLDGEVNYRPADGISLYLSGSYLHTRMLDDLPVGDDFLPTKGKRAVASPSFQLGAGGTYDDGRLFGTAGLKYVSRQYSTFMNDQSFKGYATLDLSIGVHLQGLIDDQRMDLRLNAINVTNPRVLSGVYSLSGNANDTMGRNGTMIEGAAPRYYIGGGRAFVATLSRAF